MKTCHAARAASSRCAFFLGTLLVAGAAAPGPLAAEWRWTAETVVDMARVSSAVISPDGEWILYTVSRSRKPDDPPGPAYSNLYLVPFEKGVPRRMTTADAEDKSPAWSSDGRWIAFIRTAAEPKSKPRLFVMPRDGGEPVPLTDDRTDVAAFAWRPDGAALAYAATDPKTEDREKDEKSGRDWTVAERDLRTRRLWTVEIATREARPVASAGNLSVWEFEWSPGGESIAATVSDTPKIDDSYVRKRIVVLPARSPGVAPRPLVEVVGKVDQLLWSRDGATIAYRAGADASDSYSGSVFVVPAAGGTPVNLTGDRPESVTDLVWMEKDSLAAVVVTGTRSALLMIDTRNPGVPRVLIAPGDRAFLSATASRSGRRFALAASTADGPPDVYAGEKGTGSAFDTRRVAVSNPDLASFPRGRQETVTWKARDGLLIEGVLVRPVGYPSRGAYPLVVIAHGGPESNYLDGWNTSASTPGQVFAERGYFVLYPNYRGSTGRGAAFAKADHRDLGGKEFTDVLDGIDDLAGRFPIDKARVGITGGSYGGYFTGLGVTRYSERFAAGASLFGISDWISFLGQTDIPVENSQVHWDLWCYDHVETCREASPVGNIGKAGTPTLILQGDADPRVPKPQSDQLYAALRWKGVPVEYLVFPREKHGFRERAHQIEAFERVLLWFQKYLRP